MGNHASALESRRKEAYRQLEAIDASRLRLAGCSIYFIAGRAGTTEHFVLRWLKETAARDRALPTPEDLG
jgi:hypothetical protein